MANRVLLGNVKGDTGATGLQGATGANGNDGLTPYILNGTWWLGTTDTGVTASGNQWFTGEGSPTTQGINGDLYLDTLNEDVYKKSEGVWNLITNIKGSKGDTGAKGDKGDTALTVTIGEVITGEPDTDASVVNVGTDVDLVLNFIIPKGEKGTDGVNGIDGSDGRDGRDAIISTSLYEVEVNPAVGDVLSFSYDEFEIIPSLPFLQLIKNTANGKAFASVIGEIRTSTHLLSGTITSLVELTSSSGTSEGKEDVSNKTQVLNEESTEVQYPSAKAVVDYVGDIVGDIESLLSEV